MTLQMSPQIPPITSPTSKPDPTNVSALVGLNARQRWILDQLHQAVKLHRAMIEVEFNVTKKTAKRNLSNLRHRGLIRARRMWRKFRFGRVNQPRFAHSVKTVLGQAASIGRVSPRYQIEEMTVPAQSHHT